MDFGVSLGGEQNSSTIISRVGIQVYANGLITVALRFRKVSPQATSLRKSSCESCQAKFLSDEDGHCWGLIQVELPSGQPGLPTERNI